MPSLPHVIFLFLLGGVFLHFLLAGGRTFAPSADDDRGAGWAQFSFVFTGTIATWFVGLNVPIRLYNGIASGVLLLCSLALYEWARHVIWGRRFYLAWSGSVPDSLCEEGPYLHIRHPIYASYILAFLAALVALPTVVTLVVFIFNAALFTHAAFSDESGLSNSTFAAEYAQYKRRTGMFIPRIFRRRSPADAKPGPK
jgi:protein-S-isoprenylcysteine O-methyltransferase Ste14